MSAKFYILFVNISLMILLSSGVDQENEAITASVTVTESISESTLQPEEDNIYLTCDFDLENIETLLQYMPDICTDIYYNRFNDSTLYNLYLEESRTFDKFYKKLNAYELRNQPNGDMIELKKYPFEAILRKDIYTTADWAQCITTANDSVTDYLNCLIAKRLEITDLIPSIAINVKYEILSKEDVLGKEL